QRMPLPHATDIWEGSRMSAAPELDTTERRAVLAELKAGMYEFAFDYGVKKILFQMPPKLTEVWMKSASSKFEILGDAITLADGSQLTAGWMFVDAEAVSASRSAAGCDGPIIRYPSSAIPYARAA